MPLVGLHQLAGQVHPGAVDGEQAVSPPAWAVAAVAEDLAVQVQEQVLVHPRAGLADRRGRHRFRLRQGDAELAALLPEFGHHGGITLLSPGQDQPEHEQHDDQAVENAAALSPAEVVGFGQGRGGVDDLQPHRHQGVVAVRTQGAGRERLRGTEDGRLTVCGMLQQVS